MLAVAAGAFFVMPLLVHAEENPIFVAPGGQATLHCNFTDPGPQGGQFPSDTVYCRRRIGTNTAFDVSMLLYLDEDSFKVYSWDPDNKPTERGEEIFDARRDEFISFWKLSLVTKPVVTTSIPEEHDLTYDPRYIEVCPPTQLAQVDGGPNRDASGAPLTPDESQMCRMGVVRGINSPRAFTYDQQPVYERQYFIGMTETDTGEDQSEFKGWSLEFDMIFRAKLPAEDTCPTTRTDAGICAFPIYERP